MEDVDAQRLAPLPDSDVAIVGGGWAGMAAALELAQAGHRVQVFEAGPVLGGRARRVALTHADMAGPLDNGQHLLLGAYRHTLALMRRAGIDPERALVRLPLQLCYPDGWNLCAPRLPAPWHLLGLALRAQGPTLAERLGLARQLLPLRRASNKHQGQPHDTVSQWLDAWPAEAAGPGQGEDSLWRRLWEPLCVAAMNTPANEADAAVFRRVLADALFGQDGDSDMLIPARDLSALFPEAAAEVVRRAGGAVSTGSAVRGFAASADGWSIDTARGRHRSRALVVATAPQQAARLLAATGLAGTQAAAAMLADWRYAPIVTVHVNVGGLRLPRPFLALSTGDDLGQFVFDRAALAQIAPGCDNVWSVVISAADDAVTLAQDELARRVRDQLARQLRTCVPDAGTLRADRGHFVVAEKRATFRCVPGLPRPHNNIGVAGLALAGDYTAGPYPATIEAAMRSGSAAARLLTDAAPARGRHS
ncbi:hydroxysqualene dehydroxylase HpnE [Cupriavidus sp. AU9028]|uniref:hydroxysqualene dehydroxylase HpnE n=1 Tax=Cupriavidus sp. AU9028 TaxID=2871157 RepID=UPI001C968D4C|nr:hydroxysqualene dehydroxylase HpnE [Cupriavidus sp. AU9028]MBY4897580.1 hydroxysqualene dehydroxylase HpnE [Cupriavidus sp. AU9028]